VGKSLPPAIQKIVQKLNPEKIVLFGSYAYGTPNPHSDVDLLVSSKTQIYEGKPENRGSGCMPAPCFRETSKLP
jgi:predicted nucleotidyltransferase